MRKTRIAAAALSALSAVTTVATVAPGTAYANHGAGSSPVVGYIQISYNTAIGQTQPSYVLFGALASTALWTCSDNITAYLTGFPTVPYKVTCTPASTTVTLGWHCDVLHADIQGLSTTTVARTSLDCNGVPGPEAQTALIAGPLYQWNWAASNMVVTEFSCTVDGGNTPAALPSYRAGCGDPGIVRFQH